MMIVVRPALGSLYDVAKKQNPIQAAIRIYQNHLLPSLCQLLHGQSHERIECQEIAHRNETEVQ